MEAVETGVFSIRRPTTLEEGGREISLGVTIPLLDFSFLMQWLSGIILVYVNLSSGIGVVIQNVREATELVPRALLSGNFFKQAPLHTRLRETCEPIIGAASQRLFCTSAYDNIPTCLKLTQCR